MEKRLYKSSQDRMISGVCGGLGEYLGIDSTIIRLGVAALAVASCGTILMLYLIALIIIPEQPRSYSSRNNGGAYDKSVNREEAEDLYETSAKPRETNDEEPPVK